MTNLNKLRVSLTKHGAHKIAILLRTHERKNLVKNLWGVEPGINVEKAQALKNLSADAAERIPALWDEVRLLGEKAIDALVLIAIISSHKSLIDALKEGATRPRYKGRITRGDVIDGKAFTNFKHTLVELGYGSGDTDLKVEYNFEKLFKIPDLSPIAAKLLSLKLKAAKWDESNSLEDELIKLGFHKVFSIDEASFRAWLTTGASDPAMPLSIDDEGFFEAVDEKLKQKPFVFKKGHTAKKVGKVRVSAPTSDSEADLMHNAMQTKLYQELLAVHGDVAVGTEISSGSGTTIDVVVKTANFCWFYEIKTADSVKACIRQAIPQLLEYAYWQCDAKRADKLIIVGPKPITVEGEKYLQFLRDTFKLELYYESCSPLPT